MDHSSDFFFNNRWLTTASYFAVALFILLSGLTLSLKHNRCPITLVHQIRKIAKLFAHYAFATLICYLYEHRRFDIHELLYLLTHFTASPPFFFLFFFFQLELIAPVLLRLPGKLHASSLIAHLFCLGILSVLSALSIRFTTLLPLHGGGKYLFGGTYLMVFYLGIILERFVVSPRRVKSFVPILVVSSAGWLVWLMLMVTNRLHLDALLEPFFGPGFDPPSVQLITFTLLTFFVCYSLLSLVENSRFRLLRPIFSFLKLYGRFTLPVFLYHILLMNVLRHNFPSLVTRIFPRNVLGYLIVALMPFLVTLFIRFLSARLRKCFS